MHTKLSCLDFNQCVSLLCHSKDTHNFDMPYNVAVGLVLDCPCTVSDVVV